MSLRDLAAADQAFLVEDDQNGFAIEATFTDLQTPTPGTHTVLGLFFRIGVDVDPETGLLVQEDKATFTARISSFTTEPEEDWRFQSTDITGATVKGRIVSLYFDRTVDRVTMVIGK